MYRRRESGRAQLEGLRSGSFPHLEGTFMLSTEKTHVHRVRRPKRHMGLLGLPSNMGPKDKLATLRASKRSSMSAHEKSAPSLLDGKIEKTAIEMAKRRDSSPDGMGLRKGLISKRISASPASATIAVMEDDRTADVHDDEDVGIDKGEVGEASPLSTADHKPALDSNTTSAMQPASSIHPIGEHDDAVFVSGERKSDGTETRRMEAEEVSGSKDGDGFHIQWKKPSPIEQSRREEPRIKSARVIPTDAPSEDPHVPHHHAHSPQHCCTIA